MSKTVLIVEDEQDIREDISTLLKLNDYNVLSAMNGIKALEVIEKEVPDLILSDVMMPEMDGYELLENLQKSQRYSNIPFLFLTAKTDKKNMREGMNLGADDYIPKPFDFQELLSAIDVRLKKKERSARKFEKKLEDLRRNIRRSLPHEIRTPLNSIIGFSDLLVKTYDHTSKDEMLEMLTHINDSGKRLSTLMEKYLLYANLEILMSSPDEIKRIQNYYISSSQNIITDYCEHVLKKFGRIEDAEYEIHDSGLKISEEYFLKLLEELIENACKFSEQGTKIKIKGRPYSKTYELSITDSGRGMTREQIDNYEAYIQFERKVYEQQGSGLGLTIVKSIVKIFGGTVAIDSEPGQYTSVSVKLPVFEEL